MTEQPITITRVPSDPPHYRASDGAWSMNGMEWCKQGQYIRYVDDLKYAAAFHAQILAPTTPEQPEQPERARVGQHFLSELTGKPCRIREVDAWGVYAVDDEGTAVDCRHGHYTIVDPPEPPTATGDKITERDGVWESAGRYRYLVIGGKIVICVHPTLGSDYSEPTSVRHTLISTDPADLNKGWKGGE